MKVQITTEEYYPVYEVDDGPPESGYEIEIPDEVVQRWKRVHKEFKTVQREMREAYEKAYGSFY